MAQDRYLIAGATGIIGRRLTERMAQDGSVVGLSRRPPDSTMDGVRYLPLDLTDASACLQAMQDLDGISHIFYAARHDHDSKSPEKVEENLAMLRNLVEAAEAAGHPVRHVHVVQGTKYYGSNLGPFKTPARESDARVPGANFYFAQEDYLIARENEARWTWSTSRPHGILDDQPGIARSMAMVIAVYAALLKALGEPLSFPGTPGNFEALYQCTNTAHLADGIAWLAATPGCANQAFNVINGDYVRWRDLWPVFAEIFGMKPGPVRTVRLTEVMADKAPLWDQIVEKYGLVPQPYEAVAVWPYGDHLFTPHWDMVSSIDKLRAHGFTQTVETKQSFLNAFAALRAARIIP